MHGHELVEQLAALVLVVSALATGRWWPTVALPRLDAALAASTQRAAVAALATGAAIIHFAVAPAHPIEHPPYGVALALLAGAQIAIAALAVTRRIDRLRLPAVALNLGAIAVWIASRTIGLPIGSVPWHPDPLGVADGVATAFEAALVGLLWLGGRAWHRRSGVERANVAAPLAVVPIVGGLLLVALLVATSSLVGPSQHEHPTSAAPTWLGASNA